MNNFNTIKDMAMDIKANKDAFVSIHEDFIDITFRLTTIDSEGYEEAREFTNEELVNKFFEILEAECFEKEGEWETVYHFDNGTIQIAFE